MTLNKLASLIAKREGKKHQASIGDIREILRILIDIESENKIGPCDTIFRAAIHRASKTKKRVKK